MNPEIVMSIAALILVWAIGVLCGISYAVKHGYNELPLIRVGWAILDDNDIVMGYAKTEEEFGATMRGHNFAMAKPMYVKTD